MGSTVLFALAAEAAYGGGGKESVKEGTVAIKLSMLFPGESACHCGAERWPELV